MRRPPIPIFDPPETYAFLRHECSRRDYLTEGSISAVGRKQMFKRFEPLDAKGGKPNSRSKLASRTKRRGGDSVSIHSDVHLPTNHSSADPEPRPEVRSDRAEIQIRRNHKRCGTAACCANPGASAGKVKEPQEDWGRECAPTPGLDHRAQPAAAPAPRLPSSKQAILASCRSVPK